ncbi:MAG: hypothetical protein QM820_07205 [Minicystis sp.]
MRRLAIIVWAALVAGTIASCAGSEADPLGSAEEPWCSGIYVTHAMRRPGTLIFVSPETLAVSTDGCGPQALALSVNESFSPQVSYQVSPSISKQKNNITKSLTHAVGFSVTATISLTASTVVLVPTGAYYRIEAYPEYEVIDWQLRADACGPNADFLVTTGTVYRPIGIHFRISVLVGGEWNAFGPPSPAELLLRPPWSDAAVSNGESDAGSASTPAANGAAADAGDGGT